MPTVLAIALSACGGPRQAERIAANVCADLATHTDLWQTVVDEDARDFARASDGPAILQEIERRCPATYDAIRAAQLKPETPSSSTPSEPYVNNFGGGQTDTWSPDNNTRYGITVMLNSCSPPSSNSSLWEAYIEVESQRPVAAAATIRVRLLSYTGDQEYGISSPIYVTLHPHQMLAPMRVRFSISGTPDVGSQCGVEIDQS